MGSVDIRARVEEMTGLLLRALQTRSAYGKEHVITKEAVDKLYFALGAALSGRNEITIGIIGDEIAFEERPLYKISKNTGKLITHLKKMKIEKISFLKDIEEKELDAFVDALAMNIKSHKKDDDMGEVLRSREVSNILIGNIGVGKVSEAGAKSPEKERGPGAVFQEGLNFLRQTLDGMGHDKPVDIRAAHFVVVSVIDSLMKNASSLLMLTMLRKHDEHTFIHSLNTAVLTLVQAEALRIPEELLTDIGVAALLHDIGKLSIEADIIKKRSNLSRQELEKVRSHPIDGAEILLEMPEVPLVAAIAAFEHHLKYDTQGYPARLYGNKLNLASMIISIADAYDEIRAKWSGREAFASEKTYEEMMELSGENFHPELLDIFFRRIGVYPPGTLVELDNKAVGLVVKENGKDMKRPQVDILYDSNGGNIGEPYTIDLLERDEKTRQYKHSIVKSIAISDKYAIPSRYMMG